MKVRILGVVDRGELSGERLIFRVRADTDIGDYLVIRAEYDSDDDQVTTAVSGAFWFPDRKVSAGDLVVLYTKRGRTRRKKVGQRTVHFYYWGKKKPLWGCEDMAPVILHAPSWQSTAPQELGIPTT